jgi:hypothetical protein
MQVSVAHTTDNSYFELPTPGSADSAVHMEYNEYSPGTSVQDLRLSKISLTPASLGGCPNYLRSFGEDEQEQPEDCPVCRIEVKTH